MDKTTPTEGTSQEAVAVVVALAACSVGYLGASPTTRTTTAILTARTSRVPTMLHRRPRHTRNPSTPVSQVSTANNLTRTANNRISVGATDSPKINKGVMGTIHRRRNLVRRMVNTRISLSINRSTKATASINHIKIHTTNSTNISSNRAILHTIQVSRVHRSKINMANPRIREVSTENITMVAVATTSTVMVVTMDKGNMEIKASTIPLPRSEIEYAKGRRAGVRSLSNK